MPDQSEPMNTAARESSNSQVESAPTNPVHSCRSLVKAFLKPNRGQAIAGIALFITALLVTWTLRSQHAQPEFANARRADLIQLLDTVTSKNRDLEKSLRNLEALKEGLRSGADKQQAAITEARQRITSMKILAGLIPAHGPGIRITIDDPNGNVSPELLLNAMEELRDAGAEVIELNDKVRIVVETAFTGAKGRVNVGEETLRAPYQIEAIGDPATLEAGARFRGGLVSEVEGTRVGGAIKIVQLQDIDINSVVLAKEKQFARPR